MERREEGIPRTAAAMRWRRQCGGGGGARQQGVRGRREDGRGAGEENLGISPT